MPAMQDSTILVQTGITSAELVTAITWVVRKQCTYWSETRTVDRRFQTHVPVCKILTEGPVQNQNMQRWTPFRAARVDPNSC